MKWKMRESVRKALDNVASAIAAPDLLGELIDSASPEALIWSCHPPLLDPHSSIHTLFSYRDPLVQRLISSIKDEHRLRLASSVGLLLVDLATCALAEISEVGRDGGNAPLLCPVPITKSRHRIRGYSQTEFLCEAMMTSSTRENFEYCPKLLTRNKHTPPQTSLKSRNARLENLRGTFSANISCAHRTIVVIDDVATTGATLTECRRALRVAGAAEVILIAVARAE